MSALDYFSAIGGTPLVELPHSSPKPGVRLFAKLEGNNPSGSIKDRVALRIIQAAEESGALTPGQTIVEASTGNMALALAACAKHRGYTMRAVVPPQVAPGIPELLELFGVEIQWAEPRLGMLGPIEEAQRLARENGWWFAQQFASPVNVQAHYDGTGPEVLAALPQVDALVAGIGTGGTITGVGRRLKERNPRTIVVGVEPQFGERLQGLRSLEEGYIPRCWTCRCWTAASWSTAPRRSRRYGGWLKQRASLAASPPERSSTPPVAWRRTCPPATWSWSSPTPGGST